MSFTICPKCKCWNDIDHINYNVLSIMCEDCGIKFNYKFFPPSNDGCQEGQSYVTKNDLPRDEI